MATGRQLKAAILVRRAAKGPRKRRTRPEPRQYTAADLERARDRVAAAERRIDNDRSSNPNRGRAGLERAQLELSVISRNYASAASLSYGSIELCRHPGERVEGSRSRLCHSPDLVSAFFNQRLLSMSWSISSIECGEIPSSPIPGMSGDDALSICISSTWFRVIGGLGNISAIRANACQAANGTGSNMGLMPAALATVLRNSS